METEKLLLHAEALLFAADRPLTAADLEAYLNGAFPPVSEEEEEGAAEAILPAQIEAVLKGIEEKYAADAYPFALVLSGGGYRFLTKKEYHTTVLQLNGDRHLKKLSAAALETLSIVAYKGPVTKGEIEFIRGVSADYALQKLLEKELIFIAGRKEDAVGKPLLYQTSRQFMDYLGINSPADLPQLKDLGTIHYVEPTDAEEAQPEETGINKTINPAE
jgi:segregation and condensation protein B